MNALVLAIVLVTAMQSGPQAELETIVRDNMSNVEDAKQVVARTPAEWAALWRRHAGDQAPRRRSTSPSGPWSPCFSGRGHPRVMRWKSAA